MARSAPQKGDVDVEQQNLSSLLHTDRVASFDRGQSFKGTSSLQLIIIHLMTEITKALEKFVLCTFLKSQMGKKRLYE